MTESLQNAFSEASKLPEAEQDLLASRLLAELATETDFDRAIVAKSDKLRAVALEALDQDRRGLTTELDFDH